MTKLNTTNLIAKKRLDSLQVVRALAFLGIFAFHCDVGTLGAWGASVFIVLSGFLMVYAYYDKKIDVGIISSIKFSVKKIRKLYPLHLLMALAALPLVVPVIIKNYTLRYLIKNIIAIVLNLLLLHDWIPNSEVYFTLNGVSWYLSLCLFLYFAFPLVLRCIKKLTSVKQAIITSIIIYLFQCFCGFILQYVEVTIPYTNNFSKWFVYICPAFRLGDFVIGCCWGYVFINGKLKIKSYIATLLEIVTLISIPAIQIIYDKQVGFFGSESFRYSMLYTVLSVAIVYLFAINKGLISKLLTCKPLLYLGNISAYTFLIHQIVIRYIIAINKNYLNLKINSLVVLVVAFIVTILISELYKRIEKAIKKLR